jgi:hypothetical protein
MIRDWFEDLDDRFKTWAGYAIGIVAVLGVGYFTYGAWVGADGPLDVTLMCTTEGCGYTRERPLQVGESVPASCPDCDKASVFPAFRCSECKTYNVWNEDRGLSPPTKCRECGHENYHGS